MSLITQEPPYDTVDVERIARALVERRAFGGWITDQKTVRCFTPAIARFGATKWLEAHRSGLIYLVMLAPPGVKLLEHEEPRCETCMWFDADATLKVLVRCNEIEEMRGKKVPAISETAVVVAEVARNQKEAFPEFERRMKAAMQASIQ